MSRIAREGGEGKKVVAVTEQDRAYVGLDVRKERVHYALWVNGQVRKTWSSVSERSVVARSLEPYRAGFARLASRQLRGGGEWVCNPR